VSKNGGKHEKESVKEGKLEQQIIEVALARYARNLLDEEHYRDSIGVDYYNLDVSDENKIIEFIEKHSRVQPPDIYGGELIAITEDQPIYRAIADKIIRKEMESTLLCLSTLVRSSGIIYCSMVNILLILA